MISPTKSLCVYQFKITLKNIRPLIWRRLLVRSDTSLAEFHDIVQIVMGWKDCHLHQFSIEGQIYGQYSDSDFGLPMLDESEGEDEAKYTLTDFSPPVGFGFTHFNQAVIYSQNFKIFYQVTEEFEEKNKFHYEYDFGDGWEHDVVVEKVLSVEPKQDYPICIGGKRACPPEDCGGPWAYGDFLDAVQNTGHLEHEEMLDWVGGEFDSEDFDVDTVNGQLH